MKAAADSLQGVVLVLEHIRCEPPGIYGDILEERGFRTRTVRVGEGEPLPPHTEFAAAIIMGGPMGAMDDHEYPWLAEERAYLASLLLEGVPCWGVCLGAQLIAEAAGGRVFQGHTPEVGTYEVRLTQAASSDPVFRELPERMSVFQWHNDTFDLPPSSIWLASSATYANQAFRIGRSYGIQFHLEVDRAMAAEWGAVPAYRDSLDLIYGSQGLEMLIDDLERTESANRRLARTMFEAFLQQCVL